MIVLLLPLLLTGCAEVRKDTTVDMKSSEKESGLAASVDNGAAGSDAVSDQAKDLITVGYSQLGSESDWRLANSASFRETFTEANGYYLLFADGQQKQENQLKAVRNFILQDVDYIVIAPVVETGWDTVLQEARDAGIPVILADRMVNASPDLYTCYVGANFVKEAEDAGHWLERYLEEQGRGEETIRIVELQGTEEASAELGRTEGFANVLADHPNWELLEARSGDFTQAKGQEVMEYFLETYEDIDVVVSQNDNMTFGAIDAIEATGRSCGPGGDMIIISYDAVRAAFDLMMEGKINADFECNPLHGPRVDELIRKMEAGETVEKIQYVEETWFDTSMDLEKIVQERTY